MSLIFEVLMVLIVVVAVMISTSLLLIILMDFLRVFSGRTAYKKKEAKQGEALVIDPDSLSKKESELEVGKLHLGAGTNVVDQINENNGIEVKADGGMSKASISAVGDLGDEVQPIATQRPREEVEVKTETKTSHPEGRLRGRGIGLFRILFRRDGRRAAADAPPLSPPLVPIQQEVSSQGVLGNSQEPQLRETPEERTQEIATLVWADAVAPQGSLSKSQQAKDGKVPPAETSLVPPGMVVPTSAPVDALNQQKRVYAEKSPEKAGGSTPAPVEMPPAPQEPVNDYDTDDGKSKPKVKVKSLSSLSEVRELIEKKAKTDLDTPTEQRQEGSSRLEAPLQPPPLESDDVAAILGVSSPAHENPAGGGSISRQRADDITKTRETATAADSTNKVEGGDNIIAAITGGKAEKGDDVKELGKTIGRGEHEYDNKEEDNLKSLEEPLNEAAALLMSNSVDDVAKLPNQLVELKSSLVELEKKLKSLKRDQSDTVNN